MKIQYYYINKFLLIILFFNLIHCQLPSFGILHFNKKNIKSDRAITALQVYLENEIKLLNKYNLIQQSQTMTLLNKSNFDITECDEDCIFESGRLINIDFLLSGEVIRNSIEYYLTLKLYNIKNNSIDSEIIINSNMGFTDLITKARKSIKNKLMNTLREKIIVNSSDIKTDMIKIKCEEDEILLWNKCYSIKETDTLDLSGEGLNGFIPKEISKLENLIYLDLSGNDLGGVIPYEINNLIKLEYLNLDKNKFFSGKGNLSKKLNNLSISNEINSKQIQFKKNKSRNISEKKKVNLNSIKLDTLVNNNSKDSDNKKWLELNNEPEKKLIYDVTLKTNDYDSVKVENDFVKNISPKDNQIFKLKDNKETFNFINTFKQFIDSINSTFANSFKRKSKISNNIEAQQIILVENEQNQSLMIKIKTILENIKLSFKSSFKRENISQKNFEDLDNENSKINDLKKEILKSKLKGVLYTTMLSGGLITIGNSIRIKSNNQYDFYYLYLSGNDADKAKSEIESKDQLSTIFFLSGATSALGSSYIFNLKTKTLQKELDRLENK